MATILPSTSAQMAPGLSQITETVLDIMNPNRKIQAAMQAAFVSNPALIQQFANIEKQAPGLAASLGLGKLAPIIAAVPETTDSEIDRTTRGDKVAAAKTRAKTDVKKAGVEDTQTDIQGAVSDETVRLLASNARISEDAARRLLQVQSQDEETIAGQTIDLNEARLQELDRIEQIRTKIPALQAHGSMRDIARKFIAGELQSDEEIALFSTPEIAQGFATMMSTLRHEADDALRREQIAASTLRGSTSRDELTMAQRVQRAFTMYRDSNNAGNLDAWEAALFDKDKIELLQKMVADPTMKGTAADQPYREIADYYIRQGRDAELENTHKIARITASITAQERGFNTASEQERLNRVENINLLLKERAQLGGPVITAHMPARRLARDNVLEYRDAEGNKLSNREVASLVGAPTIQENTGPAVSPTDQPYVDVIMSAGNKQATFDKLMLEDPTRAKRIEASLRAQGVIK